MKTVVASRKAQVFEGIMEGTKKYTCPLCGAKLDFPVDEPGCGGDPSWHEEGFAEIEVVFEFINEGVES